MKLFKIEFTEYEYDEYDSVIIVAEDVKQAEAFADQGYKPHRAKMMTSEIGNYTGCELPNYPYLMLGSFNAG